VAREQPKTGTGKHRGLDEQLAHVMAHHIRVKALTIFADRTASPKEVARELRESLNTVSHHVKQLHDMGLIELVDEVPRRGTVEHFYRSVMRPILNNAEWEKLGLPERQQISAWLVQLIISDAAKAMHAGTFDVRLDRHVSRAPLVVDEEGWREIVEINAEALDATLRVQEASAERMAKSGENGIYISSSILCMEMPAPKRASAD